MKKTLLLILLSAINGASFAQQTDSRNYVLARTYKQSGANQNNISQVNIQVDYFDGLGRPLQQVQVGRNPAGHDLVQAVEYDDFGRQVKTYLPYIVNSNGAFQPNAASAAAGWYAANSTGLEPSDLDRPFAQTFYEPSPLNRPSGQRSPGNKSASALMAYKVNVAGEIKRYDFIPASNTISEAGYYPAGTLYRLQSQDEQGNESNEYTDLSGRTVCKTVLTGSETLATYYVYDYLDLLRAVLQPGYQQNASLAQQAFVYSYDERKRMITKSVPGGSTTEYVYDDANRLALSRDPNQAARNVWAFIKYDALNRPIVTGEIASSATRSSWATTVAAITNHHETRSNGVAAGYSLNQTAPTNTTEADLLTITFYDDHAFQKPSDFGYTPPSGYAASHPALKGHTTGGRARVLPGTGGPDGWLSHIVYYDAEYRPIQTIRQLHDLGSTAIERTSIKYKYDLTPVIEQEKTEQVLSGSTSYTHTKTYSYDHADRLLNVYEQISTLSTSKAAYTLAQRYNALGMLSQKWFHGYTTDATRYRRSTAYTYNIRSWMTEGHSRYWPHENYPEDTFYAFDLAYDNPADYTNGNISRMRWRDKDIATYTQGLNYTYDGANRLTSGNGIGGYPH